MVVESISRDEFFQVNEGYELSTEGILYGLVVDDEVVSVCGVRQLNWWIREVFGVYTKEEHRGKGYAGKLLGEVCKEEGVVYFLTCRVGNEAMERVLVKQKWRDVTVFCNQRTGNFLRVWCYQVL